MTKYAIVKLAEEHIADLLEIYNYYILNSTATFHEKPLTLAEMRDLLVFEKPPYETWVIKADDKTCGYVFISPHSEREAYRYTAEISIYLLSEYHGKGVGSMALKHMENIARSKGLHTLLAVISGENKKSIALFEKNNYRKCAHYKEVGKKFGRWLDIVSYQKLLQ